jgi:hypothetical protein
VAKTWVLDTETKGTGAHMAPLRSARSDRDAQRELSLTTLKRPTQPARPPEPPPPLRFRVVDVMSGRVLAEDVGAREAVRVLEGMRSSLDSRVSVWSAQAGRWRLLGLEQQRELWGFRHRIGEQ